MLKALDSFLGVESMWDFGGGLVQEKRAEWGTSGSDPVFSEASNKAPMDFSGCRIKPYIIWVKSTFVQTSPIGDE